MKHRIRNAWRGIVLVAAGGVLWSPVRAAETAVAPGPDMKHAMIQHRETLLKMELGPPEGTSQNAEWLRAFLVGLGTAKSRTPQDWQDAFRRLVGAGMREHRIGAKSGFIEEPPVVELAVSALGDEDPELRSAALRTLTWSTRQADLETRAAPIKAALAGADDEDALRLLARLPSSAEEQAALRGMAAAWPEIRARLGDAQAESGLIAAFRAEPAYQRMHNLARDLGYVGSPACVEALLAGLRSQVSSQGVHDDRSIRCAVLVALGRVYQTEPLFTNDAWLLSEQSDEVFDQRRGLAAYATAVNDWVRERFGVEAWDVQEVWFVRYSNRPRIRRE